MVPAANETDVLLLTQGFFFLFLFLKLSFFFLLKKSSFSDKGSTYILLLKNHGICSPNVEIRVIFDQKASQIIPDVVFRWSLLTFSSFSFFLPIPF